MCGWATDSGKQYLKAHITKLRHHWTKHAARAHTCAKVDIKQDKREEAQKNLPQVHWGEQAIVNYYRAIYLGSLFQVDGDQMPDIRRRIAMAMQRAGKLRHVWAAEELSLDLRMRLYRAAVCSILVYGSEAWFLNDKACKALNGANARMVSHITGRTVREEASPATWTFDIV